jgi:hypothetical protein
MMAIALADAGCPFLCFVSFGQAKEMKVKTNQSIITEGQTILILL